MQIAQAEGKQWKEEVHKNLIAYRSTPHTTTRVKPAELLFGRKIQTKLPEFGKHCVASEVQVRDREMKTKAKLYADKKGHAEYSGLVLGDRVLQKQEKQTSFRHHLHQNHMTLLAGMAAALLSSLLGVFS